jgi:MYXO-CTERM domain-containing protein
MIKIERRFAAAAVGILGLLCAREAGAQCIDLTTMGTAYTQNFDTLANTGTTNPATTLPTGWLMLESTGDTNYAADNGSLTGGNTYSYGAAGSTERAFGTLLSGTNTPTIGACFTNKTGATILSLTITYTGEQWRVGTIGRVNPPQNDGYTFEYSTDATGIATTAGTWTPVSALNYTAPTEATGTAGPRDGNDPAHRTTMTATFNLGSGLADQATIYLHWLDINAASADDGIAVDDFSLTPNNTAAVDLLSFTGFRTADGVALAWQTGSELDCGAFTIARCDRTNGACDSIAAHVDLDGVVVACHDDPNGARYRLTDTTALPDVAYSYVLREHETTGAVNSYGSVVVGPDSATAAPAGGSDGFGANGASQGCSAGGAAAGWAASLLLLGLAIALRRRRRG